MTSPDGPALPLDRVDAVVFDTDGVLTDTASVHAAAWKRLFDQYLQQRAQRLRTPFHPAGQAAELAERGADLVVDDLGQLGLGGRRRREGGG